MTKKEQKRLAAEIWERERRAMFAVKAEAKIRVEIEEDKQAERVANAGFISAEEEIEIADAVKWFDDESVKMMAMRNYFSRAYNKKEGSCYVVESISDDYRSATPYNVCAWQVRKAVCMRLDISVEMPFAVVRNLIMNRHADLMVRCYRPEYAYFFTLLGVKHENIHVVDITDKSNIIPMRDKDGNEFMFAESYCKALGHKYNNLETKGDDFMDYLKIVTEDKADIVIGNPPFGGRTDRLWAKISNIEIEGLKAGAVIAFITPQSFIYQIKDRGPAMKMKGYFIDYRHKINLDMKNYFEGVGSSFSGWLLQNKKKNSDIKICGKMADVIKKMITNKKEKIFSFKCQANDPRKSSHSDCKDAKHIWKISNATRYYYSDTKSQYYDDLKVIGNQIGCAFFVEKNCGTDNAGYLYLRPGYEYELAHAYNSKIIKDFLLYMRVGTGIPNPIMRQLPNFSDTAFIKIRKVIEDSNMSVQVRTKELSPEVKMKINQIVKDDLGITSDDEATLAEMLNDKKGGA